MIAWVDGVMTTWGIVMRARLFSSGYPPKSSVENIMSGRGGFVQHVPEIMMPPDVYATDLVMRRMEIDLPMPTKVVWIEYVYRVGQRRGSRALNVSHHDYRAMRDTAHGYLAAKLEQPIDVTVRTCAQS